MEKPHSVVKRQTHKYFRRFGGHCSRRVKRTLWKRREAKARETEILEMWKAQVR